MKIVSLFSGAGGMDLGLGLAGHEVIWANEYDRKIWDTYKKNHASILDQRSITDILNSEIPECDGLIGGPPCQSWSLAGKMRGLDDPRGQLFFQYLRVLNDKKPKFFVAENVPGMKSSTHAENFGKIRILLMECGYSVFDEIVNASDYGVPQDRKRVVLVGYRNDLGKTFAMPPPLVKKKTLRETIGEMPISVSALPKNMANPPALLAMPNHEHMTGGYSYNYMSRNRVRLWDQPSFTIIASGRHAPQHPSAPPMKTIGKDVCEFDPIADAAGKYRRLSVRECARIQTFPDSFEFVYTHLSDAYKMIGNAVPVELARVIGSKIKEDLE